LLYSIDVQDLRTFAVAIMAIAAVAAIASWLPARRAARLDAADVLRI
jgi:ABC-type lipoprotein release transport system permease subunit